MLAVAGGKGGCGKTTTTLGVASALARQRKPVLAVDSDPEMPDLHAMSGVAREPGLEAVAAGWPAAMIAGRASAAGVPSGVAVLPADASSGKSRSASEGGPADRTGALARVSERAGTVLLDCPAGAGPDAAGPLRLADAAVLVTTAELACLRDAAKTAAMARELGTPVAGAVVSRAADPPDGVADLLDCGVLGTVPDAGGVGTPHADEGVRAAHDRLVSALQPKYL